MPVAPARLFDSRSGPALGVATTTTVRLPAGVPTDAVALALNLTMTESAAPGYVTEFPAGAAMPTSSVLNVDRAGQTRAAAGIFPVSAAGMSLFVSAGGHLVVDIVGYFTGPSAAASTSGLFTAVDPSRLLDTRSTSPLGSGVPLYAGGGIELAVAQGASLAMNVTSVDGDAGFVTAFPAGTPRPGTSTVNSVGAGDVAANFAIAQLSNRGLGVFSQSKTHLLVDVEGWFSGPLATATLPPLTNSAPPTGPTYSECTHEGLASFNATRAGVGARALTVNAGAERFACAWALRLATAGSGISHSSSADRDAAAGCATGENVAYSTGSSPATLIDLWYGSPTHLANLENASYVGVGIGYVVRTETSGATTIYGVTDLALC